MSIAIDGHDAEGPTTASVLARFGRDVLLANGRTVRVRPSTADDVAAIRAFYEALSDTSSYFRFFHVRRTMSATELEQATHQDLHLQVTLVAEAADGIIGVGEYCATPSPDEVEVAFAVADRHHHEGIATLMLEDLALIAQTAGYRRLVAQTLEANAAMKAVFKTVGLAHRSWIEDGTWHVELDLTSERVLEDSSSARDWQATVRSLQPILHPGHVVVFGAGRSPSSPGRRVLENLIATFTGRISVVHPRAADVAGVPAVRAVADLDSPPDLAVVAIPAAGVATVIDECGAAGVPAAVVISSGFAEAGPAGVALEESLLRAARRHGMRIVGPNCLGVTSASCGLNATFMPHQLTAGGIAVASQSGGVGIAIAAEAAARGVGLSSFVSMGNKVDVSGNDVLRAWADDPATSVVLLYLESFGDPARFARVARAVSRRKPVVALKAGRSSAGIRGAASHTAALAADDVAVDALFAHTGVMRARTLEQMIDLGVFFDRQPTPRGRRVALVGNAGGPLVLAADAAEAYGLEAPAFSPQLQDSLRRLVPDAAAVANPVDLLSTVSPDRAAAAIDLIAASGEVDSCVLVSVDIDRRQEDALGVLLDAFELDVPLVACSMGAAVSSRRVPTFTSPERAVETLAIASRRGQWLSTPDASHAVAGPLLAARRIAREHVRRPGATPWLDPEAVAGLLDTAGVPIVPWRYAVDEQGSVDAARGVGPPYVMKADVEGLVHKTDEGAVVLGLTSVDSARATHRAFVERFGRRLRGALIQRQAGPGVEFLVGVRRDPAIGPLLVVAAGGVDAEILQDRTVLLAPSTAAEIDAAIEGLRCAPLMHGYRGRPALPTPDLVSVVQRVGELAVAVPEITDMDLNPVILAPDGAVVVDARIAVSSSAPETSPLRAMRRSASPETPTSSTGSADVATGGPAREDPPQLDERRSDDPRVPAR